MKISGKQPFELQNYCFLECMAIQSWASTMGWPSRILSSNSCVDGGFHASTVIEYQGRLRQYDCTGTCTLKKGLTLNSKPLVVAKEIWKKVSKAEWKTTIVR